MQVRLVLAIGEPMSPALMLWLVGVAQGTS